MAGTLGGEIVGQGNVEELLKIDTLTSKYLRRLKKLNHLDQEENLLIILI